MNPQFSQQLADMPKEHKARAEQFIKEYGELVKKYGVDFMSYPMHVPTKEGFWNLIVQTQLHFTEPAAEPLVK